MSITAQMRTYTRQESATFRKTDEEFGGLSNMAPGFPLCVNGVNIRTAEALYQACRFPQLPDVQRVIIDQVSPMTAKMKGKPHRNKTRADWERVRTRVMRWCLRVKLAQNWMRLGRLLVSTGGREIVEESRKDDFWGAFAQDGGTLVGRNVLGRLLTELRDDFKRPNYVGLKRVDPVPIDDFLLFGKPIETVQAWDMPASQLVDPDQLPSGLTFWGSTGEPTT